MWFRIDATSDTYMPIVRWGDDDNDGNDDEYEIALGDENTSSSSGNVVYRYATDYHNDRTKCETTDGPYDDGNWHFAVGTRSGDDDCKLYVDGVLKDGEEECDGCGSSSIDVDDTNDIYIGYDGDGQEIDGDVAMMYHWNNQELLADDVLELYYTNFGDNGTRITWTIERTDQLGVTQETIFTGEQILPFHDPAANSDSSTRYQEIRTGDDIFEKYQFANATFTTTNATLNQGDRLKSIISWPGSNQNLDINVRFDDTDSSFGPPGMDRPSYIQTPHVDPTMPTFITFSNDDELEYLVFNNGPNGAWFTSQETRFVITTTDGLKPFGGIIKSINGSSLDPDTDSIFIPDQNAAELEFYRLANPPSTNPPGNTRADHGQYNAAVLLSGFDDKGETFLRTINVGFVNVVD